MTTSITSMVSYVHSVRFDMKTAIAERNPRPTVDSIVVRIYEEPPDRYYDYLVSENGLHRVGKTVNRVMFRHIKQCQELWTRTVESVMPPPVQKTFHDQEQTLQ